MAAVDVGAGSAYSRKVVADPPGVASGRLRSRIAAFVALAALIALAILAVVAVTWRP
jgi:hypothetical protein